MTKKVCETCGREHGTSPREMRYHLGACRVTAAAREAHRRELERLHGPLDGPAGLSEAETEGIAVYQRDDVEDLALDDLEKREVTINAGLLYRLLEEVRMLRERQEND